MNRDSQEQIGQSRQANPLRVVWVGVIAVVAGFGFMLAGKYQSTRNIVVAYCAQDQVFAEPILKEFTRVSGVEVRTVFDSEAVKTVGLANRLLAERDNPQCDVFWGNEELRTRQLVEKGVFPANRWATFGYRTRRVVINTNLLSMSQAPKSLFDLTNAVWRGKVALAYPMFGTTSTHFQVLRQHWGETVWEGWCRALAANKPLLVDGNSVVVQLVGRGEALVGLTDSDDVASGQREQMPVMALPLTGEKGSGQDYSAMYIPNSVAITVNAPHPKAAQQLFDFLQKPEVARLLVEAHALEGVSCDSIREQTVSASWPELLKEMEPTIAKLKGIFLR